MPQLPPLKISIIIPVLNEVGTIAQTINTAQNATAVEIIVVDGGSTDGTIHAASTVKVISAPRGRAHQMNAGAAAASGDILLFLHADTRLPPEFDIWVRQTLAQPGIIAGAFQLKIDGKNPGLRLVEKIVNLRSRYWQMPYGDQAIFLKTTIFQQLGGFPNQPIMEDFELVRRLQRIGQIAIAPLPIITSARRWQKLGIFKTTLINQIVIIAYFLGVSPHRIVSWYRQDHKNAVADNQK
ncbi:MAG TPA: TIGR04283 family arsenosugar biosynthesis glycosyltransferase [Kamptonema sp.]|nr:TIGR04283 family arsenosugar biosynthesis glycosyltransferase [Kamptonema sp.]